MSSTAARTFIVVIGGSYVGTKAAEQLSLKFHDRFKVLLIEKNSHFQHLFAFPRFAVTSKVNTHKAFIPYGAHTFGTTPPGSGSFIQAKVTDISKDAITLDRKMSLDGFSGGTDTIPYAYLVIATGTKLSPPSSMPGSEKLDGVAYLKKHVAMVEKANNIVIIGGGAVGVQTACDIKELYSEKEVTLVHSRQNVMNKFHHGFNDIIMERFRELGVDTQLGSRVKLPAGGYPTDGSTFEVELEDGIKIPAEFAIVATGQTPNSDVLKTLSPEAIGANGFVKVRKTLQIDDEDYPNIFAIGDVAATPAHKAARPAMKQVDVVVNNIEHSLQHEPLEDYVVTDPSALHLTLGIGKNVIFRNPAKEGAEPVVTHKDDGRLDMGIDGVWTRRGGGSDHML